MTPKSDPRELYGESIDQTTFEQILEMDDDDERAFSHSIVDGFLDQAENAFGEMEEALSQKDLEELSRLGHFLKGSSATLGFTKFKDMCERIQNWGLQKDEKGEADSKHNATELLAKIQVEVEAARREYDYIRAKLKTFYRDPPYDFDH